MKTSIITLVTLLPFFLFAQFEYEQDESGIEFTNENQEYLKIQVCQDDIIRVLAKPSIDFREKKSLVVVNDWKRSVMYDVEEKDGHAVILTSKLKVYVNLKNGAISFYDKNDKLLLSENQSKPKVFDEDEVLGEHTHHVQVNFKFSENEALYGLGQFQDGDMNYRGKNMTLVQCNKIAVVPTLVSTNGYGVLWDNYSKTRFKDFKDESYLWSDVGSEIDYYFLYGPTMDEVIANYREASGQAPMFARWAYGYWQSKERYKSRDELLNTIAEYRKRRIPIDNMVQDWQYWGNNDNWSALKFDPSIFPNPVEMMEKMHNEYNAQLIVSIWPTMGMNTDVYAEMKDNGLLYQPQHWSTGYMYDAFSKKGREIYWKHIKKGLMDKGVDGLWMDGTEPEVWEAWRPDLSERHIKSIGSCELGNIARYLNAYSLMTTQGTYTGQRAEIPSKRVYTLTRSAFAGQQRNAAVTWSGDIIATWDVYKKQISAGLNFCMAGVPYWTTDIGAFFVGERGSPYKEGCKDPAYGELYTRWFQYGAFCPIFRSHGTSTPREVWQFGDENSEIYKALVKVDKLRYRLMPYIYSNAWKVTNQGYTLMRGLPMDFPSDENVLNNGEQFMFGSSILVCPVTKPQYHFVDKASIDFSNHGEMDVYLPKGTQWFDYWTNKSIDGGQTVRRKTPIDIIPLYIKAGSILPIGPEIQYTSEKLNAPIEIHIYEGADGSFELYEDENDNYNYEQGKYSIIQFNWNNATKSLTIQKRVGEFEGMQKKRKFEIVYHTIEGIEKRQVVDYKGKELLIKK